MWKVLMIKQKRPFCRLQLVDRFATETRCCLFRSAAYLFSDKIAFSVEAMLPFVPAAGTAGFNL